MSTVIGVIGGSGVYELDGLEDARWESVASPLGSPSDQLLFGRLAGVDHVFLPRHGRGHRLPPSAIDYRANIDALKRAGATDVISVSACGSLREELTPGTFVLVDQFIDRTVARQTTFFDGGIVAHVAFADPVCGRLVDAVALAADGAGVPVVRGGTYLAMEGPQFSTRAESELHRSWGCDVIGMTNLPEAKLAREAELCYASLAMVTDYDCWHPDEADVEVTDVVAVLTDNADRARSVIAGLGTRLLDRPVPCPAGCDRALDAAVITPREAWTDAATARLDAVAGRVLSSGRA